ncbi:MAG: TonB-dependent receptor [Hirschia sp.]|nr:TonB-dependent receptor [Hirschia sp.]MBF18671.1 TonB-dependent receptor [Hirschia sp.]
MSVSIGRSCFGLVAVSALMTGLTVAQAQDAADAESVQDTVVVWGTAVTSNSLYLGEGEIELKQADHLSDLLRTVPGVDIGGTHSVNSRINIRGLDDRNLNVYIDGALQTNYLYHHMGNLLINADILESADVQLGANTVTHGGIGGSVRFDTKDAADLLADGRMFGGRLMASYNDNAQTGFSGTGYGRFADRADVFVYFNRVDRDNFEDGSGRETIGSDGTTDNWLGKIGFDITENQRIELSYDRLEDSGDYTQRPDMGVLTNTAITGDILIPTEYTRETVNLSYGLDLGDAFNLSATYYMNAMSLWRDETSPLIPRSALVKREAEADNQGVNLLAISRLETGTVSHTLKYGVEYFDQELAYHPDLEAGTAPVEQEATSLGIFLEDEIGFADRLFIRPGVRFNDYEVTYLATGESGSWDEITYGLGGEFIIVPGLSAVASYTELFKGPELAEPFGGASAAIKIVNPDLEPQTGDNVEFGLRYANEIAGARITAGANWFETTLDNYIAETSAGGAAFDANIGTASINGFEASLGWGFGELDLLATWSTADFDASELDLSSVSTESIREIGDQLGLQATHFYEPWNLTTNWNLQQVMDKTTSTGELKPGYSVNNISLRLDDLAGWTGLSLTGGVDNLFDEAYTSHASRTGESFHPVFGPLVLYDVEPGRNVKVTLSKVF